jgi:N-acetylmuramoyl-L-alanine amidase
LFVALSLLMGSRAHAAEPNAGVVDVVLDPGHGGSNFGSPGRGEVLEKRVTLALAKAVRQRLHAAGLHVQLTRTNDGYVPIRARARIANTLGPRCFVSIHANASGEHTRNGVETYFLSRDAIDIHARRLASLAGGDADAVLADLRALSVARAAMRLAESVQRAMVAPRDGELPVTSRGVRQAAHDVLADAEVPSILVEVGFLDHPVEGRWLASSEGQAAVADRLADGILAFLHAPPPDAPQPARLAARR